MLGGRWSRLRVPWTAITIALAVSAIIAFAVGVVLSRGDTASPAFARTTVPRVPSGFVYAAGGDLLLDGALVRFTGINLPSPVLSPGLAFAGPGCGSAAPVDVDQFLGTLRTLGANTLVRVWLTQAIVTDLSTGTRDWSAVDAYMAALRSHPARPKVMVTLATQSGVCDGGAWHSEKFYAGAWQTDREPGLALTYEEWVREIVGRFADDPTVAIWELVDEADASTCPDGWRGDECYGRTTCGPHAERALRRFFDEAGALVHELAPNQLVAGGEGGGPDCGARDRSASLSPEIDVLSFHDHRGDPVTLPLLLDARLGLADELAKPLVVGEAGVPAGATNCTTIADRSALLAAKAGAALTAGADGYVLWRYGDAPAEACDTLIRPGDPVLAAVGELS